MNLEEYKQRKQEIRQKAEDELNQLAHDYVMASKKANIGDVIFEYSGSPLIIVEEITYRLDTLGVPVAIYSGQVVNKQLKPYKRPRKYSISNYYFGKVANEADK